MSDSDEENAGTAKQVERLKKRVSDTERLLKRFIPGLEEQVTRLEGLNDAWNTFPKPWESYRNKEDKERETPTAALAYDCELERNASMSAVLGDFHEAMQDSVARNKLLVADFVNILGSLTPLVAKCRQAHVSLRSYDAVKSRLDKTQAAKTGAVEEAERDPTKISQAKIKEAEYKDALVREDVAIRELSEQMQKFEDERSKILTAALGGYAHGHVEHHAHGLVAFTRAYREHDSMFADNIEAEVGMSQSTEAKWRRQEWARIKARRDGGDMSQAELEVATAKLML